MDCKVCTPVGDSWLRVAGHVGGQFSHESDHDLGAMVSDFLENGSGGADSWCSSDSESGFSDLIHLADKISFYKCTVNQYESDLLSVVHSLLLSMTNRDLQIAKLGLCKGSCIRFALAKFLRHSGYDAAVCDSKWQGCSKVPGGDHEYIDVLKYNNDGSSDRLIIDIDFRSHFEIARAVESYDKILNSLPVVYVGSLTKLKSLLQVMSEAVSSSLKQNSMPVPPWRSLAYLQAKWQSPFQRRQSPKDETISVSPGGHKQCGGHLRRLVVTLQTEIETERLLKPLNVDPSRRMKLERRRTSSLIRMS
ncbi:hypothetical protein V2J09_023383 [Rumex salicifolius]